MRSLFFLLLLPALRADQATEKMMARVSEEAEAFRIVAPQVLGKESLHQRAMKPPPRFRPRVGAAVNTPPPPRWNERDIVSEYGYASLGGVLHELRQVTTVDGRKVADDKKAQEALAKAITASDDARKKEVLKQFEKYGLIGAVTDFGQLLLLFTRREMERYEFTQKGAEMLSGARVLVFHYKQIDGPEGLTLVRADKGDQVSDLNVQGEIWVQADNYLPLRITMEASQGTSGQTLREESSVDYAMSPYGALLPTQTSHRETAAGKVTAENKFVYSDFHKFGASSDIKFEAEPDPAPGPEPEPGK
jgi:hypothetical protein